jgi:hypothetical protein
MIRVLTHGPAKDRTLTRAERTDSAPAINDSMSPSWRRGRELTLL